MNKFVIKMLTIICGIVLLTSSCSKTCDIKIPKGVKPINWENYNDVYTVFWNYVRDCNEQRNDIGRDIKVYGWIFQGPDYPDGNPLPVDTENFALISNEEDIFWWNFSTRGGTGIYVHVDWGIDYNALINSLKIKFDSTDITKKCYISGKLSLSEYPTNYCCSTTPEVVISSIDDIKFEGE